VYADGDNAATRTGTYQISGAGITTTSVNLTDVAGTDFNGTFTQASNSNENYVKFTITAAGFTITATPGAATDGNPRAPVNAIQIVRGEAIQADSSRAVRVIRAGAKTASSLRTRTSASGIELSSGLTFIFGSSIGKCGFRLTRLPPTVPYLCPFLPWVLANP
jgi:hypothetical protein